MFCWVPLILCQRLWPILDSQAPLLCSPLSLLWPQLPSDPRALSTHSLGGTPRTHTPGQSHLWVSGRKQASACGQPRTWAGVELRGGHFMQGKSSEVRCRMENVKGVRGTKHWSVCQEHIVCSRGRWSKGNVSSEKLLSDGSFWMRSQKLNTRLLRPKDTTELTLSL